MCNILSKQRAFECHQLQWMTDSTSTQYNLQVKLVELSKQLTNGFVSGNADLYVCKYASFIPLLSHWLHQN